MERKQFQFGQNPIEEDSFEKKMILQDKVDRRRVRLDQTMGAYGTDGGKYVQNKAQRLAEFQIRLESILE